MLTLTTQLQEAIAQVAQRHGFSVAAGVALALALAQGGGRAAQFNHPELGGMGQWMPGGMTMIGDMFNHALKARVDALGADLAALLANTGRSEVFAPAQSQAQYQRSTPAPQSSGPSWAPMQPMQPHSTPAPQSSGPSWAPMQPMQPMQPLSGTGWWPAELGTPNAVGAQNDMRYAYFAASRRLAILFASQIVIYDTLDHQIGGVSQAQSFGQSLTFTSQKGLVRLEELPVVGRVAI